MGQRNNPSYMNRRDDDGRNQGPSDAYAQPRQPQSYPQSAQQQGRGGSQAYYDDERSRRVDEYHVDPYMVGNNTYRDDSERSGNRGPGYYGGGDSNRYAGAGYWDADYERSQREAWHSDDYRRPHYGGQGQREGSRPEAPYQADRNRDYRAGDRPAGGYGSYGSSDGSYGDVQRHDQQYGQGRQQHFDPDYHQWRSEQMDKLDSDYHSWRADRYQKFSDEFNSWRSSRKDNTDPKTGVNHDIEASANPSHTGTGGKQAK
jgi:hypothetical protein